MVLAKPCPSTQHPNALWTQPGLVTPPLLWAAHSSAWPPFQRSSKFSSLPWNSWHTVHSSCRFCQMTFSKVSTFHTVFLSLPSLHPISCLSVIRVTLCHCRSVVVYPLGTIKHAVKLRKILGNAVSATEPPKGKSLWKKIKSSANHACGDFFLNSDFDAKSLNLEKQCHVWKSPDKADEEAEMNRRTRANWNDLFATRRLRMRKGGLHIAEVIFVL